MLGFDRANSEINVAYMDLAGSFITMPDMFAILPNRGGIQSPYNKLKIIMELLSPIDLYKLHTLEIHNPENCNVKLMDLERLDFLQQSQDKPILLTSERLNNVTFIDVDYFKAFHGLNNKGDKPDYFLINLLETTDGKNPGTCELRGFAEINNF